MIGVPSERVWVCVCVYLFHIMHNNFNTKRDINLYNQNHLRKCKKRCARHISRKLRLVTVYEVSLNCRVFFWSKMGNYEWWENISNDELWLVFPISSLKFSIKINNINNNNGQSIFNANTLLIVSSAFLTNKRYQRIEVNSNKQYRSISSIVCIWVWNRLKSNYNNTSAPVNWKSLHVTIILWLIAMNLYESRSIVTDRSSKYPPESIRSSYSVFFSLQIWFPTKISTILPTNSPCAALRGSLWFFLFMWHCSQRN